MTNPIRAGRPEPLIYYLHAALLAHCQAISATSCKDGDPMLRALAPDLRDDLRQADPLDLAMASTQRLSSALRGIDAWRAHPYSRDLAEPQPLWEGGGARLLDYAPGSDALPVLAVPSLINNGQVLDLCEKRSFLRKLQSLGLRPCLIEWGDPTAAGAPQSIEDYVCDVLVPATKALRGTAGRAPAVLGYCVGGTLSVALASQYPELVHRLALIGAPWDFSHLKGVSGALKNYIVQSGIPTMRQNIRALGAAFGAVPASQFQHLFALLAPMQLVQKFSAFDRMDPASAEAEIFVAVEDWLASGVPVATGAAETILIDWYVQNQTALGQWKVRDTTIDPSDIACPALIITGTRDHIVPNALGAPLADKIQGATLHQIDRGHVGMIVGSGAHAEVATPIYEFFVG